MENRCVACGEIIPEGYQVCPNCMEGKMDREQIIKTLDRFSKERVCLPHLIPWEEIAGAVKLLKERKRKTGHWIYKDQFCEAWSNTCSECGKIMTTHINDYASYCWNCGAKMERPEKQDDSQKD